MELASTQITTFLPLGVEHRPLTVVEKVPPLISSFHTFEVNKAGVCEGVELANCRLALEEILGEFLRLKLA